MKCVIRHSEPLPKTKEELKKIILQVWNESPPEECKRLVATMPKRCAEVIKNKGFPTKY